MPQSTQKNSAVRHAPPLAGSASKQKHWGGRGAGTPAPQLRLAPAKFGAGKFCRFTQRKNKNQEILEAEAICRLLTNSDFRRSILILFNKILKYL